MLFLGGVALVGVIGYGAAIEILETRAIVERASNLPWRAATGGNRLPARQLVRDGEYLPVSLHRMDGAAVADVGTIRLVFLDGEWPKEARSRLRLKLYGPRGQRVRSHWDDSLPGIYYHYEPAFGGSGFVHGAPFSLYRDHLLLGDVRIPIEPSAQVVILRGSPWEVRSVTRESSPALP